VLGVSSVPMTYEAKGKQRSLRIAGVAEAEIEAIPGQGGEDMTIDNHLLCISPGYQAVVSRSKTATYKDHGLDWEFSGKNAFYSPFTYQGG
jgi:hypothetical protein